METTVLDVKNLSVTVHEKKSDTKLLFGSSFQVKKGECLGILGESGSGKSLTMGAVMGLLSSNFEVTGEAWFDGKNLLVQTAEELRKLRGSKIAMVLQNPMTSFDPLCRIEEQIRETFEVHTDWSRDKIYEESVCLLEKMQIREPQEVLAKYPHQLSGGMLQRIMIGMALSLNPELIIADEATTALDAITQFEVLKAFRSIKDTGSSAIIFITHDLGAAAYMADRILVMNCGRIVDRGTFSEIRQSAKDEYTKLLIQKKLAVMEKYRLMLGRKDIERI